MTQATTKTDRVDRIRSLCSRIEPATLNAFLARLEPEYVDEFPPETIARHIQMMASLSAERPAAIHLEQDGAGAIQCTIIAFDHPFEFSSITGLMAGSGFSIEKSAAFTLHGAAPHLSTRQMLQQGKRALRRRDPTKDALILDHFQGKLSGPIEDFKKWSADFEPALIEVMRLLDQEDERSTERAKRLVNERVTQWLKARRRDKASAAELAPIDVQIEQLPHATRLRLRAPDAPAFLYALSTALSLHGLQIEKTRVQTIDGQAVDEIDLVDSRGRPLVDENRIRQLRLSILLTQRFAYFLDRAPDPFTALQRFEELAERIAQTPEHEQWVELLNEPLSMVDLAKVLGASDFLWEDFIRVHADQLLPALARHVRGIDVCPPSRSLPRRLEEALAGSENLEDAHGRLNQFKDRELFLIDLDHILASQNLDAAFQILSERLVMLAENLVTSAARLVYDDLVRKHGAPQDEQKRAVGYAIFGLGKLGGVALGYASDIELLFLYESEGKTKGRGANSIANGEFFAQLVRQTCDLIPAKGRDIFRVDLRLRPYGKGGPLASSRAQFAEYYGENGPAHPFERLALVRLRWIAGDPHLGFDIERLRDHAVYEGPPLDLDQIWDVWGKMRAQHVSGRQLNSKHSPGALADLEGTVQLLQVMHAKQAPQLRTPRLHEAIESLHRAGVLSPAEFDDLMAAYQFLRRLINAQRILRGSAQDLLVPAKNSPELVHLARRMNYLPGSEESNEAALLLNDLQKHTQAVRQFIKKTFGRECPGQ